LIDVLIDARLRARGLGIASFLDRLDAGLAAHPDISVRHWGGDGSTAQFDFLAHGGLFDVTPRLDPRVRADVVHFASNLCAAFPGRHAVVTVHDLLYRQRGRAQDRLLGALLVHGVRRAERVVAISERTKVELEERLGLRGEVLVIPHGQRRLARREGLRSHLLAFGGGADPRKRVDLTLSAYAEYRRRCCAPLPLVVLGRAGLTPRQRQRLTDVGGLCRAEASTAEVDDLFASAAALVYPSRAEGFGLPIVEAAEHATPVVLDAQADLASEVRGRHCFEAHGTDPADWADQIDAAVAAGPVPDALDLPTWDEVADQYVDLYRDLAP